MQKLNFIIILLCTVFFSCSKEEIVQEEDNKQITTNENLILKRGLIPQLAIQPCGVIKIEEDIKLPPLNLNKRSSNFTNPDPIVVKIKYHIVREDDGTDGIPESDLDIMTNIINQSFDVTLNNPQYPVNSILPVRKIDFIATEINYIDNTELLYNEFVLSYGSGSTADNAVLVNTDNDPYQINIYIVKELFQNVTLPSGEVVASQTAGIGGSNHAILSRFIDSHLTKAVAHEVGHCFRLRHTFSGSYNLCYEENFSRNTGDHIADTPLDISANGNVYGNTCEVTNTDVTTTCGEILPDEDTLFLSKNIMSYAPRDCKEGFTPLQYQHMHNSALYYSTENIVM